MASMVTVLAAVCFLALPTRGLSDVQKVKIYNSVPAAAAALCEIPAGGYDTHPLTKYMCSAAGQQKLVIASKATNMGGKCHVDPKTKRITCQQASSCEGGTAGKYSKNVTVANITFDCKTDCGSQGTLFLSCCDECAVLKQDRSKVGLIKGKYQADNVFCVGCGDKLKEALANSVDCTLKGSHYECQSQGQCSAGSVSTHTQREAYACQIEDCNRCTDKQLKAECCLKCSQGICSGSKQLHPPKRYACLGCTGTDLFIPAISSPAQKVQSGLIIAVAFVVIVAAGCAVYFAQQLNWARSAAAGDGGYLPLGPDADHEAAIVE